MDARVKKFRSEVLRQGIGGVGKRYPSELRDLAVTVAQERSGEPLSRVAEDLGIRVVSLQRWLEQTEPVRFRPVEISVEAPKAAGAVAVLVTPGGYRVERPRSGVLGSLAEVSFVIGSTRQVTVYAFSQSADLRRGFDGLSALVREAMGRDELSGDLYVFVSRDRRRAKVLLWDGTGLCVYSKRLERGRFACLWGQRSPPRCG